MTLKPTADKFGAAGHSVCSYIVEALYTGKRPFLVGAFTVRRAPTEQETEAAALSEAALALRGFFGKHFPDATTPPDVVNVRLGSVTFIPDDYDWRRA